MNWGFFVGDEFEKREDCQQYRQKCQGLKSKMLCTQHLINLHSSFNLFSRSLAPEMEAHFLGKPCKNVALTLNMSRAFTVGALWSISMATPSTIMFLPSMITKICYKDNRVSLSVSLGGFWNSEKTIYKFYSSTFVIKSEIGFWEREKTEKGVSENDKRIHYLKHKCTGIYRLLS